jgi:hypothetical protein
MLHRLPCTLTRLSLAVALLATTQPLQAQGWLQPLPAKTFAAQMLPLDGGFVVAGGRAVPGEPLLRGFVSRWNGDGTLRWERLIAPESKVLGLTLDDDGRLRALLSSSPSGTDSLFDYQLDTLGNFLSARRFVGQALPLRALPYAGLVRLAPNRSLAGGLSFAGPNAAGRLFWLDDAGAVVQQKNFPNWPQFYGWVAVGEGRVLVAGRLETGGSGGRVDAVVCLDSLGNECWARTWPGSESRQAAVARLSDGNVAIFFSSDNAGRLLVVEPAQGNVLVGPVARGGISGEFSALAATAGCFFLNLHPQAAQSEFFIEKIDNQGVARDTLRSELPGFEGKNLFVNDLLALPDGHLLLSGFVQILPDSTLPFLAKIDSNGNVFAHTLRVRVAQDADANCEIEPAETRLSLHKIELFTPADGRRSILLTDAEGVASTQIATGEHLLRIVPPNAYWQSCQSESLPLRIEAATRDTLLDFPMQRREGIECPYLQVDIGTAQIAPCAENRYFVRYCNTGTAVAQGAFVRVELSERLAFLDSPQGHIREGERSYRFPLGDVAVSACRQFSFRARLTCEDAEMDYAACVGARIFPDTFCQPALAWSGASVAVVGRCLGDSVRFVVRNVGTAATSQQLDYVIIEDDIMRDSAKIVTNRGDFGLQVGDSLVIVLPANGSTWRVEAQQEPGHPGRSFPAAFVEGCGRRPDGSYSTGYAIQFAQDDADPTAAVDCRTRAGSAKQGFPTGVGEEQCIAPGQEIEYVLQFVNRTQSVVNQVIVRDTLSPHLDPLSLQPGASGAAYRLEMGSDGAVAWHFDSLSLTPSGFGGADSVGFVKFRIAPRAGLPDAAQITNRAAVYFGQSPTPILTNTTRHTLRADRCLGRLPTPKNRPECLRAEPNPADARAPIFIRNTCDPDARLVRADWLSIADAAGRRLSSHRLEAGQLRLGALDFAPGVYFLLLYEGEKYLGATRVVLR